MHVSVNDRDHELAEGTSLGGLLERLGLDARAVVVERNGEVVARSEVVATPLADGDRLIVVRAVAGGAEPARSAGELRRRRLAAARIYLVTDARTTRGDLDTFLSSVCDAGVGLVQLRDKDASDEQLRVAAAAFRRACDATGALFVVNDRPDLAVEVGADGAHVGQDDLPPRRAREIVGEQLLLGWSTHGPEQLDAAAGEPVDYLGVGPVHATPTKPGRPGIGLEPVRYAARAARVPWFVTGGMNEDTVGEVVAAGARAVVVVRAITEAADPAGVVTRLRALLPP